MHKYRRSKAEDIMWPWRGGGSKCLRSPVLQYMCAYRSKILFVCIWPLLLNKFDNSVDLISRYDLTPHFPHSLTTFGPHSFHLTSTMTLLKAKNFSNLFHPVFNSFLFVHLLPHSAPLLSNLPSSTSHIIPSIFTSFH